MVHRTSVFDVRGRLFSVRHPTAAALALCAGPRSSRLSAQLHLSRKSCLFADSDRNGERAAVIYTLIQIVKRNDVDSQARFAGVPL
jgi:hypothetical protein